MAQATPSVQERIEQARHRLVHRRYQSSANDLSEVPRAVIKNCGDAARGQSTRVESSTRPSFVIPKGKSDENMATDVADRVGMFRSWKRQHTQFYQLAPYLEATLTRGKKYGKSCSNGVTFSQMRIRLIGAAGRSPAGHGEISWAQAYGRRMRRFNLEVISVALIALVILIGLLSGTW